MASQLPPNDDPFNRAARRQNSDQNNNAKNNVKPGGNSGQPPRSRSYQPYRPANPSNPDSAARPSARPNGPYQAPPSRPGQFFNPNNSPANPNNQPRSRTAVEAPAGPPPVRPSRPRRRFRVGPIIGYVLLGAFILAVLGGLFAATRVFNFLGNISVQRQDTKGNVVTGSSVTGHGRVNIVILGVDRRPNDNEGTRSDTILVMSVDQDAKTANMLSIPRDLWVKIPGYGSNRINAAYSLGDGERPGQGGPPLVKETILQNFGLKIDYFVEVDFNGFRSIVDAIGGINIDVKKPLIDNEYPTEDYGIKRIYIPAGLQHMDGQTALEYARSRHSDSDLGRNQRQQEVVLAVREQGINLGLITNTKLQSALQGAIKTDLQPGDILGLAQIAVGMKRDAIKQFSIDANSAHPANINGNDVLVADQNALNKIFSDFQTSAQVSNSSQPATEDARISVLNGTFVAGLAGRTQKFLQSKGFTVPSIDQAPDAGKYPSTIINVYNGKQKTGSQLAALLGVSQDHINNKTGAGPAGIDIEVICGQDLKLPE
ncbi:MAG TPA: LCP family protein [Chloroflexia bacterium]|nr:LCP family protein [Chloroflexia bacterium]